MIRVERYTDSYREDVRRLIHAFYVEELYKTTEMAVDDDVIYDTIDKYKDNSFILIKDDKAIAVLGGLVIPSLITKGLLWQEVIWYSAPEHRKYGGLLYRKAEELLKEQGIESVITACLVNDNTDKIMQFYHKLGYRPLEIHLIKEIQT